MKLCAAAAGAEGPQGSAAAHGTGARARPTAAPAPPPPASTSPPEHAPAPAAPADAGAGAEPAGGVRHPRGVIVPAPGRDPLDLAEVQVVLDLRLMVDVYNLQKLGWEPLLEPWAVQVRSRGHGRARARPCARVGHT